MQEKKLNQYPSVLSQGIVLYNGCVENNKK